MSDWKLVNTRRFVRSIIKKKEKIEKKEKKKENEITMVISGISLILEKARITPGTLY